MKYLQVLQDYISSNYDSTGEAMFQMGLMNFYGKGYPLNVEKGLKMIRQSAKVYPFANTFLGRLYLDGDGVTADDKKALKYLKTAASQNDSTALIYLSSLYLQSDIVETNFEYALSLLEQAVKNNSEEAMVALGLFHLDSQFGHFDIQKAFDLFLKASTFGNTNAYSFLGSMYEQGEPVEKDLATALQYYLKGTSKNNVLSHYFLGRFYLQHMESRYKKEAITHLKIAAEATHIEAMNLLADLLLEPSLEYDPKSAIRYLHDLREVYHKEANYKLGILYIEGIHTKQNIRKGLRFLRQSSSPEAALYIGDLFSEGKIVPQNTLYASTYYLIASRLDNVDAMCKIVEIIFDNNLAINPLSFIKQAQQKNSQKAIYLDALCYLKGCGVEKDSTTAVKLIKKAMNKGSLEAKALYASWLYQGLYVEKDTLKAISLLKSCVKNHYPLAALQLYHIYKEGPLKNEKASSKYLKIAVNAKVLEAMHCYALQLLEKDYLLAMTLLAECIERGYTPAIKSYKQYRK